MASRPGRTGPGASCRRDPRVEAPYRLTPQTVFRIGILGFLVLAAFAVLFFRLWALQVLSGNQFLQAAENNQLRLLRQEAPRGPIKDRYGRVLVDNKGGTAIKIWPANLPKHGAIRGAAAPHADPQRPAGRRHDADREAPRRPGDAGDREAVRDRERGPLPPRAPDGVPGHADREHVCPPVPPWRSRGAAPRLRRRDLRGSS